jgi:hypothetical protein
LDDQAVLLLGTIWWHELVGPVLLAATAIGAAAIAARTANARQAEQLAHDRELQARQLRYDREQRNRQHVRDTVDAAIANLDSAVRAITLYEGTLQDGDFLRNRMREAIGDETASDQFRRDAESGVADARQELSALSNAVFSATIELVSQRLRLALRLGKENVIVRTDGAFVAAYTALHDVLIGCDREARLTDEDQAKMDIAAAVMNEATGAFVTSCEEWFEEG